MVEVVHHPFQLALAHLPVADGDPRFRYQFRQPVGRFLDIFHVVVEIVDLAAAQDFTQNRLAYHQIIVFTHKGFYGQTTGRWGGDNRQIAHPAHRHVQRARDRRGRQGEDIDIGAHRFNALFMAHTKAVLFIDNQ